MKRVVVKIGGSLLFSRPQLSSQLTGFLNEFADSQVFFIVGGGEIVEGMRSLHRQFPFLSEEWIHWKCIDLLDTTWESLIQIFPRGHGIENRKELDEICGDQTAGCFIVRVASYYRQDSHRRLPEAERPKSNWDTTTDALGWLLARSIDADRLVLLKSCPVPVGISLHDASRLGIVDPEIVRLAKTTPSLPVDIQHLSTTEGNSGSFSNP